MKLFIFQVWWAGISCWLCFPLDWIQWLRSRVWASEIFNLWILARHIQRLQPSFGGLKVTTWTFCSDISSLQIYCDKRFLVKTQLLDLELFKISYCFKCLFYSNQYKLVNVYSQMLCQCMKKYFNTCSSKYFEFNCDTAWFVQFSLQ